MKIKKINIKNILSYNDETIDFNSDLNIFVGANGSGKSNLINILIFILKKYCFKNFEIFNPYGMERAGFPKYTIREKNPLYNNTDNLFLQKHKGKQDDISSIDITLIFEKQDIDNLVEIKNYQLDICNFIDKSIESVSFSDDRFQISSENIKSIFDVDSYDLNTDIDIVLQIREINNEWKIMDDDQKFHVYMKYFSLVCDILSLMNITSKLNNPFVFFEAYRNNSGESTKVSISDYNNQNVSNLLSWQNLLSLTYSIGTNSTYIMLATKKYGKIMRNCVEEIDGLKNFYNLEDYKRLKNFFSQFEYDINLKCIDKDNNVYQFFIKRDDLEIEIDTISSGEREIINFIFGLFLEKLKDGIVIIDEPELHLHPNWQRKLIEILRKETENQNIQFFFVTHSSSFISYNILNNIFRIYKDRGFSKCLKMYDILEENSQDDIRKKLNIINSTNNEKIFFARNVILVEGITDEILFKKIYESEFGKIDEDLEFVNISGKTNFQNFEVILKKLNINYFYIGDYDNIYDYIDASDYLNIDTKKQEKDLRSKNKSYRCLNLIESIEKFLVNPKDVSNFTNLEINYSVYKDSFLTNDILLTAEKKKEIFDCIEVLYLNNIFILKNGEIEDYLETGTKNKASNFEKVIDLIMNKEEYIKFTKSENFAELKNIIHIIHDNIKLN